jgi:hypothetical protein
MAKTTQQTIAPSSATPAPTVEVPPQVMTPASALSFLWDNFSAEHLSDADLQFLSLASEEASTVSQWLARHVNGVSCLINTDRQAASFVRSGALQDDDQTSLLNFIASQIEVIGELARIGGDASFMLRSRLNNGGHHD